MLLIRKKKIGPDPDGPCSNYIFFIPFFLFRSFSWERGGTRGSRQQLGQLVRRRAGADEIRSQSIDAVVDVQRSSAGYYRP